MIDYSISDYIVLAKLMKSMKLWFGKQSGPAFVFHFSFTPHIDSLFREIKKSADLTCDEKDFHKIKKRCKLKPLTSIIVLYAILKCLCWITESACLHTCTTVHKISKARTDKVYVVIMMKNSAININSFYHNILSKHI